MSGLGADPLDSALIRLRAGTRILGAGFLVAPDVIATCAHVIDGEMPVADFPMLHSHDHAVEVLEQDDELDIAILRLANLPPGALPVPARITGHVRDHRFRTFGFPHDLPDGIWVTGRLVGAQGAGRIQMAQDPHHWHIEPGFSGAPVWDEELAGVVGMVATFTARNETTAHLVPTTALGDTWTTPARNPYRGLQPFEEEHASLFHGRDDDIDRLARLLERQDIVAVAGPSGSGKSSLVRAGLLPRLKQVGATVVDLGPDDEIPASPAPGTVLVLDQFEETVVANPTEAREKLAAITRLVAGQSRQSGKPASLRAVLTLRSRSLDDLITKETITALNRALWFLEPMSPEQLATAIERPAAVVGGLAFESGLVQRILDDTTDEPGTLPLVSLVLDQLWQRRHGGWLTHEAYENLGRVPGALSNAADNVLASLNPRQRTAARQLLTRLTRPDGEGGYARRSVRLADLDPEIREIAHGLAIQRLVVIQDQTVNLAHQALIDHWPQLREWLAEDADFLSWQGKLQDLQESGGLLRNAPLAEASDWLRARSRDIPEHQQQFIRRSVAAQRRTRNRWRTITAVSVTLTLIAAVLTAIVVRNNSELDDRLRSINAATLAQAANRATATDPLKALQLALAAWREKPGSVDAGGALLQQRLYWRGVDHVFADPEFEGVKNVLSSADGQVVVLEPDRSGGMATVWWGLLGPSPTHREIPTNNTATLVLSPDGRTLAASDQEGGLRVWDLSRSGDPIVLDPKNTSEHLAFSANSRFLAAVPFDPTTPPESPKPVLLWDLQDMREIPAAVRYPFRTGGEVKELHPSPDGRSVVVVESTGKDADGLDLYAAVVRDLATGTEIHRFPQAAQSSVKLLDGGTKVATCTGEKLTIDDASSGAVEGQYPAGQYCGIPVDASGQYLMFGSGVLQWRTGTWLNLEDYPEDSPWDGMPLLVPATNGRLTAISVRNGAVQVSSIPTSPGYLERPDIRFGMNAVTADGRMWITYVDGSSGLAEDPGQIALLDSRGAVLHRAPVSGYPRGMSFDATGERVLVVTGRVLRIYRTAGLVLEREVPLPVPAGREGDQVMTVNASVLTTPDGLLLVSTMGMLSFWDVRAGVQTGPPLVLDPPAEEDVLLDGGPDIVLRPGSPEQLLVQTDKGLPEVWDYRAGKRLHTFDITGAQTPVVSQDGSVAAMQGSEATSIELFDLVGMKALPPLNAANQEVIGISGDYLFSKGTGADANLQVWNWQEHRLVAALNLKSNTEMQTVEGNEFFPDVRPGHREPIPLDPAVWYQDLCRVSDRDFTEQEKDSLPEGVDTERPCAG